MHLNCKLCGIECDFEVILTYGHMDGIEEHTCSACAIEDDYNIGF